jgi:hypothetical protein
LAHHHLSRLLFSSTGGESYLRSTGSFSLGGSCSLQARRPSSNIAAAKSSDLRHGGALGR